uniref:RagB/SusD family nutrient uptake outer membrane protein n=1 Tax=Roseihalotalea indica TaxID=2867963 RepID=A0AA49GTR2_9BACT|nr:RagB/SusD family nutrient uptake outer membrane protein [Tunicatimonas sp. TK19036]
MSLKNYIIILLLPLFACSESFLDKDPMSTLTDATFYKTEDDALASLSGVYDAFAKNNTMDFLYLIHGYMPCGDVLAGSQGLANSTYLYNIDINTGGGIWNGTYLVVTRANTTIDMVGEMSIDEELKQRVVAEAKFLRGLAYFNLARYFGGVPLITYMQTASTDFYPSRAPVEDVWAQVKKDFTEAAQVLPVSYESNDLGRATKGAALAMLAKTHLEIAEYEEVVTRSEEVIALNTYELRDEMLDNFSQTENNGSESIFETQHRIDPNGGWKDDNDAFWLSAYMAPPGIGTEYAPFGGWGGYSPTPQLLNAYEPGDERLKGTFLFVGDEHVSGYIMEDSTADYNTELYPAVPAIHKWWRGPAGDPQKQYDNMNFPYIRYAELLLNYAEALNEVGRSADAIGQINIVRNRSELPDLPMDLSKNGVLDAIFQERRVEFVFEYSFWRDLIRRDRAAKFALEEHGQVWPEHQRLMPIPQNEMDNNPNLTQQNPGY